MGIEIDFRKYKTGIITVELQARELEKIINRLCKNNIEITNVKKLSVNIITFDVDLKNYENLREMIKDTNVKIKILNRSGITFFIQKLSRRVSIVLGILIFTGIIAYLSNFIWGIDITTEKNISPYEIRQELKSLGIKSGINKKNINVYLIEENLSKNNENIMWARVRIIGSKLKVTIVERQAPPSIINDSTPADLIAKRDGVVMRVYTKAGTALVKNGDIVRKGQLLVKGEQGKVDSVYAVHASGTVIARTYYEETREVPIVVNKKNYTDNKLENYYVFLFGKKIYLKNSLNKFTKYDKIVKDNNFIKTETYCEFSEQKIKLNLKKVEKDTSEAIYKNLTSNFDNSVKVANKVVENSIDGNMCKVRVLVIAEENIAEKGQ